MKPAAIFLLLLLPALAFAKPGLNIRMQFCGVTSSADTSFRIKLYKDNILLHTVNLSYNGDTTLRGLDTGVYRLEYATLLQRRVSQTVRVLEDKIYEELLLAYQYEPAKETFKGFIDGLGENESLVFSFESYGCYHWETQDIKLSRVNGKYVATLYPEKRIREKKDRGRKMTKTLTSEELGAFQYFEEVILTNNTGDGGSSELTSCRIELKGNAWVFGQIEESRVAFNKLKDMLFKKR
jgi:hypothetical protein